MFRTLSMSFIMDSVNWMTLILASVVYCIVHHICFSRKTWILALPPSPRYRLPLLGHLLRMEPDLRKPFRKFRKQCGDVYSLYFGNKLVIVLAGYDTIKEALHKKGELFVNRPKIKALEAMSRGMGFANTNGELWSSHRRYTLMTLKDLGMGKSILEQKIQDEFRAFQVAIEHKKEQPFNPKDMINIAVSNIICSMTFSEKHKQGDARFLKIISLIEDNLSKIPFAGMMELIPLLSRLPGDYSGISKIVANTDDIFAFIREIIDEHLNNYDETETEDFTSAYIKEMKRLERTHQSTYLSYDQLSATISDMISAGSETTATLLRWSIICLVNYPETQERMFTEIAEHVGTDRLPSVGDRPNLTYVEAFYLEVLRMCNITIGGFPHATKRDIEFKGFTIPNDAIIVQDFDSMFNDEHIWGDPDNFRPERFLDDGKKLQKPKEFIPFSTGIRNCVGESLAKMEIFLFLSSLVQKFQLQCPDGEDVSLNAVDGQFGITHRPNPFRIIAKSRLR